MSVKTHLQQLMGGTSDIKEAFTFPGMGEVYSKNTENEDEAAAEGENKKPAPAVATKRAAAPAPAAPAAAAKSEPAAAPGSNVIGATPTVATPGTTQQSSNTSALMAETQTLTTNTILVFIIHVIFAIIIAYIWGILG